MPKATDAWARAAEVHDTTIGWRFVNPAMAEAHGVDPMPRTAASAGVEPRVMGIGPVPATRRLLDRTGLTIVDLDLVEFNEAFAAQALAVLRGLGLPDEAEHVNPSGGAIALGHPLGASGARVALTAALELKDREARRALVTMCVGQGISLPPAGRRPGADRSRCLPLTPVRPIPCNAVLPRPPQRNSAAVVAVTPRYMSGGPGLFGGTEPDTARSGVVE